MEDTQPNEVRLSRKGSTNVPRVRVTTPHASRPRWRPPRVPLPSSGTNNTELVEVCLPQECRKESPGSHHARKRWIEDQKHHLWSNRHLSVVSFKYLDRDNRVLFTCRARQPKGQHAGDGFGTGSCPANSHLDPEHAGVARRVKDSYGYLAQSTEPGPSRIRSISHPSARPGSCPQRLASIPSSSHSVELRSVGASTIEIRSNPVQTIHAKPGPGHRHAHTTPLSESVINDTTLSHHRGPVAEEHSACAHANPVRRYRPAVHATPQIESLAVLALDHDDPAAEEHSVRWSTFRSGHFEVSFPPLGSFIIPSSKRDTRTRQGDNQTLAQAAGQCQSIYVVQGSDTTPKRTLEDSLVCAPLSDQLRQHDVLGPPRSSYPSDYSGILDVEAEGSPSSPDHSSFVRDFNPACGNLPLSLGSHDKPRRILHEQDFTCVVTAHGVIDQVGMTSVLRFDHNIRSPSLPLRESIDDACILSHEGDPVILLGHAREPAQISLLSLRHGQVSRLITLHRDWNTAKKHGVSAMTSLMSPLKFASGGHDHRVHLWDIAQDISGATSIELAIKHNSLVYSLLPVIDTSHKLVSVGADRDVPIYDMSAERVTRILKTSSIPHHAHKTDFQFCTLLEVSHLETQFEIRDHRTANRPVQRFGFLTEERRGQFEKADSWSHFVGCGDKNGALHLWDLRNVSTEAASRKCFNDPIVQVVNTGPHLLACSKRNELACINFQGGQEPGVIRKSTAVASNSA